MITWRSLGCLCWLLAFALAACEGGSGSSGFDIRSENAAIEQALSTQQCVQHESLAICPAAPAGKTPSPTPPPSAANTVTATVPPAANTPTASPGVVTPTGTPGGGTVFTPGEFATPTASAVPISSAAATPTAVPTRTVASAPTATAARTATATASASPTQFSGPQEIDIGIDPNVPVMCSPAEPSGGCDLVLPFVALGFPATTSFRVAVRTVNPGGRWMIGPVLTAPDMAAPSFDAPVVVGAPVAATGTVLQAAVLVFSNAAAAVPSSVEELVDTGAEAAFVTEPFTVQGTA